MTTAMETRLSKLEDQFAPVQRDARRNNQTIAAVMARPDDLENRSRKNNVCIVGVPEKTEGQNASEYFESWLLYIFRKDTLTLLLTIERAHRIPTSHYHQKPRLDLYWLSYCILKIET